MDNKLELSPRGTPVPKIDPNWIFLKDIFIWALLIGIINFFKFFLVPIENVLMVVSQFFSRNYYILLFIFFSAVSLFFAKIFDLLIRGYPSSSIEARPFEVSAIIFCLIVILGFLISARIMLDKDSKNREEL